MSDANAIGLVSTDGPPSIATERTRRRAARANGRIADAVDAARRRGRALCGAMRRTAAALGTILPTPLRRLRPPVGAGELLLAVPLLLEPALVSWAGTGRVALAALAFGLLSGFAGRLAERLERRPGAEAVEAVAAGWRAWARSLGPPAVGLLGALALGAGFAIAAAAFMAVQASRIVAGRRAAGVAVLMTAVAVVLRVDAGAVALGTAARPPVLLFACLFGLFVGLCRHRERLVTAAPARGVPRWAVELIGRYLDVVVAALLCGLIVAYVLVLGHDPVIRAAAGTRVYLSAPFVLGGLLRCWHLAVVEERPVARGSLLFTDPCLALGALGGAAAVGLSPYL